MLALILILTGSLLLSQNSHCFSVKIFSAPFDFKKVKKALSFMIASNSLLYRIKDIKFY
ncbi:hypothetical protein HERIO_2775 [Hepatospora eriocheir]|uniref:Uncharacterized protein n=1 Tax=Hepatospora eriocheir TaxID=1081669 RepID=A0A1X0Q8F8_9MICR|nr:hypothetical protein HERIO_2775 [Hepatospora eriocheir]